jgi:hypothetical protein
MPVNDHEPADLIIRGAAVYTVDPAQPWPQALAVRGGKVMAVGSDADVRPPVRTPGTRRRLRPQPRGLDEDVRLQVLVAAQVSGKYHLIDEAARLRTADVRECGPGIADAQDLLKQRAYLARV